MPVTTEVADHFQMAMTDHPYWSESSWFAFGIPEQGINGAFYNHFRPNMNCMLAGVFMWDHTGQHSWDCLYWDWQAMRTMPPGRYGVDYDKYDFRTDWGMEIRMLEPLQRYALNYDREGFSIALQFDAVAQAHTLERVEKHGLENAYNFHFEQPGRITGKAEIEGQVYAIDTWTVRDGSHGPRFLEKVTPGGYGWCAADGRNGFHFMASNAKGGPDSAMTGGYLFRDGVMASIVSGNRRVVERIGPRPSVVELTGVDTLGRKLQAVGRVTVPSTFTPFPDRGMYWQQFAWDFDHFTGAYGEEQDYYGIQDFRKWNRAGEAVWSTR